jgi:hypothetical protein
LEQDAAVRIAVLRDEDFLEFTLKAERTDEPGNESPADTD